MVVRCKMCISRPSRPIKRRRKKQNKNKRRFRAWPGKEFRERVGHQQLLFFKRVRRVGQRGEREKSSPFFLKKKRRGLVDTFVTSFFLRPSILLFCFMMDLFPACSSKKKAKVLQHSAPSFCTSPNDPFRFDLFLLDGPKRARTSLHTTWSHLRTKFMAKSQSRSALNNWISSRSSSKRWCKWTRHCSSFQVRGCYKRPIRRKDVVFHHPQGKVGKYHDPRSTDFFTLRDETSYTFFSRFVSPFLSPPIPEASNAHQTKLVQTRPDEKREKKKREQSRPGKNA